MENKSMASRGLWEWQIVALIVLAAVSLFAVTFILDGMTEEAVRKCIRSSARFSVASFSLAFGAAALHYFGKNSFTWWVKMNRRYFGITFAVLHIIHLVFLGLLQSHFHPVFEMAAMRALTAGGVAYGFILVMLFTSFEPFKSWLSLKSWSLLHTIGGWWIWGVYMSTTWKRVLNADYGYLVVALLLSTVGLLRVWFYFVRRG